MSISLSYIDSHVHLTDERLSMCRQDIARWILKGNRIVSCAVKESDWKAVVSMANRSVSGALGVHPWNSIEVEEGWPKRLEKSLRSPNIIAVGECGLDKQLCDIDMALQISVFKEHIAIAKRTGKPLVLHCLKAWDEMFRVLDSVGGVEDCGGVVHSFNGSRELANETLKRGLYLSFNTHLIDASRKKLREIFVDIPLERILLETDAPDQLSLALNSDRNINVPQNIEAVYRVGAQLRGLDIELFTNQVNDNAKRLFRLP